MIGFILAAAGLPAAWLDFPLGPDRSGLALPVMGDFAESIGPSLISYGAAAGLFLIGGLISWLRSRPKISGFMAAGLFLLVLTVPLQVAYGKPGWLRALAFEHEQQRNILHFSNRYLQPNRGSEPDFRPGLNLETVPDRLGSAWKFLAIGWYCAMAGGLMMILAAAARLPVHEARRQIFLPTPAAYGLLLLIFVFRPLMAEAQLRQAEIAMSHGRSVEAASRYQKAAVWDAWYPSDPESLRRIGGLHAGLGRTDTGEYHLYQGYRFENQDNDSLARFEYQRAAEQATTSRIGREEAARLAIKKGLQQYADGETFSATAAWEDAMGKNPSQIQPLYYLAQAYYVQSSYRKAIEMNQRLTQRVSNRLILAQIYANMGDGYQKLGEFEQARNYYRLSLQMDRQQNFRALASLAGI